MRVGCYTLDLYCDGGGDPFKNDTHKYDEFPHQFTGPTYAKCAKQARNKGWLLGKHDLCPRCSGKRKKRRIAK